MQKIERYVPLFVLIASALLAASAITWGIKGSLWMGMHYFMGIFFLLFAMLKFFNLQGFVDGFQLYDIGAKQWAAYAWIYPFLELGLGLAYLSFTAPTLTYLFTIVLMGFSLFGVIAALRKGLNVKCACMGTVLNVPLSTVTLSEDLLMLLMALGMLLLHK